MSEHPAVLHRCRCGQVIGRTNSWMKHTSGNGMCQWLGEGSVTYVLATDAAALQARLDAVREWAEDWFSDPDEKAEFMALLSGDEG